MALRVIAATLCTLALMVASGRIERGRYSLSPQAIRVHMHVTAIQPRGPGLRAAASAAGRFGPLRMSPGPLPPFQHNETSSQATAVARAGDTEVTDPRAKLKLLDQAISKLRDDREQRKLELLANEVALLQAEREFTELQTSIATDVTSSPRATNASASAYSSSLSRGYNYGFVSKSMGPVVANNNTRGDAVPANAFILGSKNFALELNSLLAAVNGAKRAEDLQLISTDPIRKQLSELKLSNDAIWARERKRPEVKAPLIIKVPYLVLCWLLDMLFQSNPIERFYFLETVARMPYFSYITMIHTYETLGWWRRSTEAKRVHFAEELNELNHLLIMISLGGDQNWRVRFLAQHAAIVYYFVLIALWLSSPTLAYNFSELIEAHAVDTYAEFAESNKAVLMGLQASSVAKEYYEAADMYIFDEFQTSRVRGSRRPVVNNLYDVFCNIRDDEAEHVKTMASCQDPNVLIRSPNTEAALLATAVATGIVTMLSADDVNVDLDSLVDTVTAGLSAFGIGTSKLLNGLTDASGGLIQLDGSSVVDQQQAVDESATALRDAVESGSRLVGQEVPVMRKLAMLLEKFLKL